MFSWDFMGFNVLINFSNKSQEKHFYKNIVNKIKITTPISHAKIPNSSVIQYFLYIYTLLAKQFSSTIPSYPPLLGRRNNYFRCWCETNDKPTNARSVPNVRRVHDRTGLECPRNASIPFAACVRTSGLPTRRR